MKEKGEPGVGEVLWNIRSNPIASYSNPFRRKRTRRWKAVAFLLVPYISLVAFIWQFYRWRTLNIAEITFLLLGVGLLFLVSYSTDGFGFWRRFGNDLQDLDLCELSRREIAIGAIWWPFLLCMMILPAMVGTQLFFSYFSVMWSNRISLIGQLLAVALCPLAIICVFVLLVYIIKYREKRKRAIAIAVLPVMLIAAWTFHFGIYTLSNDKLRFAYEFFGPAVSIVGMFLIAFPISARMWLLGGGKGRMVLFAPLMSLLWILVTLAAILCVLSILQGIYPNERNLFQLLTVLVIGLGVSAYHFRILFEEAGPRFFYRLRPELLHSINWLRSEIHSRKRQLDPLTPSKNARLNGLSIAIVLLMLGMIAGLTSASLMNPFRIEYPIVSTYSMGQYTGGLSLLESQEPIVLEPNIAEHIQFSIYRVPNSIALFIECILFTLIGMRLLQIPLDIRQGEMIKSFMRSVGPQFLLTVIVVCAGGFFIQSVLGYSIGYIPAAAVLGIASALIWIACSLVSLLVFARLATGKAFWIKSLGWLLFAGGLHTLALAVPPVRIFGVHSLTGLVKDPPGAVDYVWYLALLLIVALILPNSLRRLHSTLSFKP